MAVNFCFISIYLVFIFLGSAYSLEQGLSNGSKNRVRRDVRPVEFDVDGEKYQFNFILSDREVFSRDAPVWLAKSKPGNSPNYTYELVRDSAQVMMDGHLYMDNDKAAVAYVHYDRNQKKIFYDGVFGENKNRHIIKSLPENHRSRARSGRKNSDHVIYKATMRNVELPTPIKRYSDLFKVKLEKPLEQLYPKLLIVIDNHLFKSLGRDVAKTIKYVATFWSAVDQKYLEIESPKVQVMVTGIIIADDEKALNYIYQSPSLAKEKNASLGWALLEQLRLYYHNDFSKVMNFQNYDATFLMTGQNIFPIGGQTFIGKICANWYNNAIVADDGEYSGIQTATHELAHLLNAEHDPLEGGECTARGPDHSISMMSPMQFETDNLVWSKCTKEYIKEFAKVKAAECLRDQHRQRHYDENIPE